MLATSSARQRLEWPLILGVWAAIAAILIVRAITQAETMPLLGDTDDAMRMVTATDLLHGQPWQDLVQYRDNVPFGATMHWSRLVDAPIAVLMALATPVFGAAVAPDVAAIAWPLLLLLPMLLLSVLITRQLVPDAGTITSLALPLVSVVVLIEFLPGRVDHHNVQIVLCLTMLWALLSARTQVAGAAIAGLAAATSLAVGLETLPSIAAMVAAYALFWAGDSARYQRPLVAFAATLAMGSLVHFLLATPPASYSAAACDTFSVVSLSAIGLGAAALVLCVLVGRGLARPWQRATLLSVAGGLALLLTFTMFPDCLGGPYASIDPRLIGSYFANIAEVESLADRLIRAPAMGVALAGSVFVALPITAWRAWRAVGSQREDWIILLVALVAAAIVMVLQVRGARLAAPLAVPAGAYVITLARRYYISDHAPVAAGLLVASWLLFSGVVQFGVVAGAEALLAPRPAQAGGDEVQDMRRSCLVAGIYTPLSHLPAGRVISPSTLGPSILRYTPHAVVSAGFHRNAEGILDEQAFFGSNEAAAREIAVKRSLDYVVTCNAARPPGGSHWPWLEPLSAPADSLQIYRILLRSPPRP